MDGIGDLLGRIKDSLDKDATTRETISNSIKEVVGFDVRLSDISIKGETVRIHTSPVKRTEIKLNESKVISKIREATGMNINTIVY